MLRKSGRRVSANRQRALLSAVEILECRVMLSTTISYTGGTYNQNFDGLVNCLIISSSDAAEDKGVMTRGIKMKQSGREIILRSVL